MSPEQNRKKDAMKRNRTRGMESIPSAVGKIPISSSGAIDDDTFPTVGLSPLLPSEGSSNPAAAALTAPKPPMTLSVPLQPTLSSSNRHKLANAPPRYTPEPYIEFDSASLSFDTLSAIKVYAAGTANAHAPPMTILAINTSL